MWAIGYVVSFVVLGSMPLLYAHTALHGFSLLQASLAVFCIVNVMICLWELSLFIHRAHIKEQYLGYKKRLRKFEFPSPMFMFDHVSLREALTLKFWGQVWSNYSLMDPSYQDQTTFGFCVDVGNGVTTLVPSLMFAASMTWPFMSARALGALCICKFWQELYGTVVYFFSYVLNQRYKGAPLALMGGVVIASNAVWIVFPALGIWASYQMIQTDSYDVFRP